MGTIFRGYARPEDQQPIQVYDSSSKIRRQGLNQMKARNEIIAWNKEQSQKFAKVAASNTEVLLSTREDFWKQRETYRDTVEEARNKQQKQQLENLKTEQANKDQAWKDLVSITESGARLFKVYDEHSKEQASLWAKQLYEETGLTSKEFNSLRSVQDHIWDKEKTQLAVWQKLRERGVSEDKIEQMRRIGGYREVAVQKLTALNLMRARGNFYEENRNTKVTILGQETTLGNVLTSGDSTELAEVIRQLDLLAIKEHGDGYPSTKILHASGGLEVKRQFVADLYATQRRNTIKRLKARQYDEDLDILDSMLTDTPDFLGPQAKYKDVGHAMQEWVTREAGPNASREDLVGATDRAVAALISGIDSGRVDIEDVQALLESNFTPRGSTKETKWGSHLRRHSTKLEIAIGKRVKHDIGVEDSKHANLKIESKQMLLDAYKVYAESNPDLETQIALLHRYKQNPYASKAQMYVSSQIANAQNTLNDATALAYVKGRIKKGEYITGTELDLLKTSTAGRAQLQQLVNASNPFLPHGAQLESITDYAEKELRKIIPKSATWGVQSTRSDAEKAAVEVAVDAFREARKSGKGVDDSLRYSKGVMKDEIKREGSDWQPSLPTSDTGGIREFSGFVTPRVTERIIVDTPNIQRTFETNPDAISTQPFMNVNNLVKKSIAIKNGLRTEIIPQASLLSNLHPNLSPVEIEQEQLKYYRNKEIEEHGSSTIELYPESYINQIQELEEPIHKDALKWLTTPQAVNKAVLTNPDPSKRTPLVYNGHLYDRAATRLAKGPDMTEPDRLMLSSCKAMIDGKPETKYGFWDPCLVTEVAFSYLNRNEVNYYATV